MADPHNTDDETKTITTKTPKRVKAVDVAVPDNAGRIVEVETE
jgi:hypothetical protein